MKAGYKCERGNDRGCDTCKYDYCGDVWCTHEPCPIRMDLEYPYGAEMCEGCHWEAKEDEKA